MALKTYVKELNNKPLKQRKQITYGVSAGVTLMIAVVWIFAGGLFGGLNTTGDAIAENNSNAGSSDTRPFAVFGSNLTNAYDAVRGAFGVKVARQDNRRATPTLEYIPD